MRNFFTRCRKNIAWCLAGILAGLLIKNIFLAMVLGFCLWQLPGYMKTFRDIREKKAVNGYLHHAMNLVTLDYMQSENIVEAVMKNLSRIREPIREAFGQFAAEASYVDVNLVSCLKRFKDRIDNKYFKDWCDSMIQCQYDRELKFVLMSHIERMADVLKIQDELETRMMDIYRDFFSIMLVAFFSYPMTWFLNRDWFVILSTSTLGKTAVALTYLAVFFSASHAFKVNKPLTVSWRPGY